MRYYFVFCQEDLLLEKRPDGTYTIPLCDEPPTETRPWTNMMTISPMDDGTEVRAYRIDSPVTDSSQLNVHMGIAVFQSVGASALKSGVLARAVVPRSRLCLTKSYSPKT